MVDQTATLRNPASFDFRRPRLDPCRRRMVFGPVRPMERPNFLERLLGR